MRVAVIGSRDYPNKAQVKQFVDTLRPDTLLISGGARGVDTWAREAAVDRGLRSRVYLPDYDKWPAKVAPLKRNAEIVEAADEVVAFWDGKSRGTIHACKLARASGKRVTVYRVDGECPEPEWMGA